MFHRQARYRVGDTVYGHGRHIQTVAVAVETPLGWQYHLGDGHKVWYREHELRPTVTQWSVGNADYKRVSGKWVVVHDHQLWYAGNLVGDFANPYEVADRTEVYWRTAAR